MRALLGALGVLCFLVGIGLFLTSSAIGAIEGGILLVLAKRVRRRWRFTVNGSQHA